MTEGPSIKVSQLEYKALVEIALAADQYLRTGSPEVAEQLRDAVLVSQAFTSDDAEDEVAVALPNSVAHWLSEQMNEVTDHGDINDAQRAKVVFEAVKHAFRTPA